MKATLRRAAHFIAFLVAALVCSNVSVYLPDLDLGIVSGNWFSIVHAISNEYHSWRLSGLAMSLIHFGEWCSRLGTIYQVQFLMSCGVLICYLQILNRPQNVSPILVWGSATSVCLATVFSVGSDVAVLGAIAFLPLQTGSILYWIRTAHDPAASIHRSLMTLILATLVCWISTRTGNQLSVIASLTAFAVAALITKSPRVPDITIPRGRILAIGFAITTVLPLITAFNAPIPAFPEYPATAQIVPDDGLPGIIRPMLGTDFPIAVINREKVEKTYRPLAIVLFSISVIALVAIRRDSTGFGVVVVSFFFAATALCDVVLPPAFSSIAPLQSFCRLVPGLAFFCLTPLAIAIGVSLGAIGLVGSRRYALVGLWLLANVSTGIMTGPIRHGLPEELARLTGAVDTSTHSEKVLELVTSPSLAVIQSLIEAESIRIDSLPEFQRIAAMAPSGIPSDIPFSVFASQSREKVHKATDGKSHSRWSPQTGKQNGDEYFALRFESPITISGIVLETGRFTADFPRGLRVSTSATCSNISSDDDVKALNLSRQAIFPRWRGPVLFTEKGFPYFGSQSDVRVYFKSATSIQCILVEQIGKTASFDWSVAEVGLLGLAR